MTATVEMIIGEEKVQARSGATFDVINPATEQVQATAPEADQADVDRAVDQARKAFDEGPWPKMTPGERGRLLYRYTELIERENDALGRLDTEDMGKPITHSTQHDAPAAADFIRFCAGLCDKLRGSQIPYGASKHIYLLREPVGVVAGILPWNFPLVMAAQKVGPALACGNVIILKPAEQSPRSAVLLGELALEAGIPPGVVNVVTGQGATGAVLVSHPKVDKISFTGSTEVGRSIMHAAAEQIRKVTLELGGKTANIVCADADVDAALAATAFTCSYNSGQICTTGSRLVIHRKLHDGFLDELTSRLGKLKVGDPLESDTKLGPLVSREQHEKVRGYVEVGSRQYTPIVCGNGASAQDRGYYVDPTIFDHVDPDAQIAQEEIFGPVLSVIDFDDEREAIEIANRTSYGLAAALWTNDLSQAHRMAAAIDSSFVWINCTNFWGPSIPYEGHRQSGVGVDMGVELYESYTKIKNVIIDLDNTPNPWATS